MSFKQELKEVASEDAQDIKYFTEEFCDITDMKNWDTQMSTSLGWIKEEPVDVKSEKINFSRPSEEIKIKTEETLQELVPEEIDIKGDPADNIILYEKTEILPETNLTSNTFTNQNNYTEIEQILKCPECDYKTTSKPSLKSHVKFHSKVKPYACTLCSYKTVDKSNLRAHLKLHAGERPHKCTVCSYKTSVKFALKEHMSIHTGEKIHKCKLCSYSSGFKASLEGHMKTHTGEKPFKCSQCDYLASTKANVKNHSKIHTDERPYQCTQCEYKAKVRFALKRHMQRIHSDDRGYRRVGTVYVKCNNDTSVSANNKDVMLYNVNNHINNECQILNQGRLFISNESNTSKHSLMEICNLSKSNCRCHFCTV